MTTWFVIRGRIVVSGLLLGLIVSGCKSQPQPEPGSTGEAPVTAESTADTSPTTIPSSVTGLNIEVAGGPGPFDLIDPAMGLADLSSYQAVLVQSFDGTRDGSAEQWSKTITMVSVDEPAARQVTTEITSPSIEELPPSLLLIETGGVTYQQSGGGACTGSVANESEVGLAEREPALSLPSVFGAEDAGSEAVNNIPAEHYTFDSQALIDGNAAQFTGEMWVAADGGYVAQYVLTATGGADFFGDGVEGSMTWNYTLMNANAPTEISLPEGCPAYAAIDAPVMPDAENVGYLPGLITYDLPSGSIKDVLTFYQNELPPLGWSPEEEPLVEGNIGSVAFLRNGQQLSVIVSESEGVLEVQLILAEPVTE